jgi:hypothetical protein
VSGLDQQTGRHDDAIVTIALSKIDTVPIHMLQTSCGRARLRVNLSPRQGRTAEVEAPRKGIVLGDGNRALSNAIRWLRPKHRR